MISKMAGSFDDPNKKPRHLKKPLSLGRVKLDSEDSKPSWGGGYSYQLEMAGKGPKPPKRVYQEGRRAGEELPYEESKARQGTVARQRAYAKQTYRKRRKPSSRVKVRRVKPEVAKSLRYRRLI